MPVNGRNKGAGFERKIAKDLTEWSGKTFERVFRSGGGAAKGDIAPAYHSWPFVAELKNRESWNHHELFNNKGNIWKWWKKVCEEARDADKYPLLIIKKNRHPALVILTRTDCLNLLSWSLKDRNLTGSNRSDGVLAINLEDLRSHLDFLLIAAGDECPVVVISLKDFLATFNGPVLVG